MIAFLFATIIIIFQKFTHLVVVHEHVAGGGRPEGAEPKRHHERKHRGGNSERRIDHSAEARHGPVFEVVEEGWSVEVG